jgi:hypothetical protein
VRWVDFEHEGPLYAGVFVQNSNAFENLSVFGHKERASLSNPLTLFEVFHF